MRVVLQPGVERFTDAKLGDQEQDPALQCGDLLLRDRLGNWTYQFAVTVDGWGQNASGVKLSKADGDTGIRELRAAGIKPGAVLGLAAHLTGLLDRPRELRSEQLAELFD